MSSSIHMTPKEYRDCAHHSEAQCATLLPAREAVLGEGMKIRRLLPHRQQRMIGAWCFFDHAGPADVSEGQGVRVGPHRSEERRVGKECRARWRAEQQSERETVARAGT